MSFVLNILAFLTRLATITETTHIDNIKTLNGELSHPSKKTYVTYKLKNRSYDLFATRCKMLFFLENKSHPLTSGENILEV
jgi:hypothetical protein